MNELTLKGLRKMFENAWDKESDYFGVLVQKTPEGRECIIFGSLYFTKKWKHYSEEYDENLVHRTIDSLRIVDFAHGDNFSDIQKRLMI